MQIDIRDKYNIWESTDGGRENLSFYSLTREILSHEVLPDSIIMTLEQVLYLDQFFDALSLSTPLPTSFRGIPIQILPLAPKEEIVEPII